MENPTETLTESISSHELERRWREVREKMKEEAIDFLVMQNDNEWLVELEKPELCNKDPFLCKQYPCPTCSAIITAMTRSAKQKIMIKNTEHNGKKIIFHLIIGEK